MKIKSKFNDYYDHIVTDYTNNVFYDRKLIDNKQVVTEIKFNVKNSHVVETIKTDNDTIVINEGFLKIGIKVFPYIKVTSLFFLKEKNTKYFYDAKNFIYYYYTIKKTDFFSNYKKKYIEEYFKQNIILSTDYPISDFIKSYQQCYYTKHNVSLVEMQFHNFITEFNTFQVYQEIEMYLSKLNEEKTVIIKDNKVVRDSKGFDKNSFKNVKK